MASEDGVQGPFPLGYVAHTMALRHCGAGSSQMLVACGSYVPQADNFVEVLAVDPEGSEPVRRSTRLPHYYPPTRIRWLSSGSRTATSSSASAGGGGELLATSGDCVRIWSSSGELRRLLRHEANPRGVCCPITAIDVDPEAGAAPVLASCDVYGTCALWDLETGAPRQRPVDLGQALLDVAFGPNGLLAAVGERGDCFLVDPRQPQDVGVAATIEQVCAPALLAWGPGRPSLFAAAWQGEGGGIALGACAGSPLQLHTLQPPRHAASPAAALQWSRAFPWLLCVGREDGAVELWHVPEAGAAAASRTSCWEPGGAGQKACTALALTDQWGAGKHAVVVATAPRAVAPAESSQGGSLWIAALPPAGGRAHL